MPFLKNMRTLVDDTSLRTSWSTMWMLSLYKARGDRECTEEEEKMVLSISDSERSMM
ncbi:BQ5605_C019g08858 [Microbotryum silenes-dioicae]|uniref:BQ5605_C019g08858 protein n=1 Tax=Microbotryum silenes-dioicae TaxID=796604 RepID=A0A2X0NTJ5_9BASI|nr:BQ5605_C019g08858 [Microbotryum silenes-dioicae]